MIKERGEPYFPVTKDEYFWPGATLRDAFAMAAMPVVYSQVVSEQNISGYVPGWRNGIAREAYDIADSMLAAREVKNG